MKNPTLRGLLALVCLALLPSLFAQDPARTFTVRDGAFPWFDRDAWSLAKVPASLKNAGPLPQQNCGSRSLDIPGVPTSVTIGVCDRDVTAFLKRYPTAQKAKDKIAVSNVTDGIVLDYTIFTLAQPPVHIDGEGFNAGMLLLEINAT